jgi:hypothetical protein
MSERSTIRRFRFPVGDVLVLLAYWLSEQEILDENPVLEKERNKTSPFSASFRLKNIAVIHAVRLGKVHLF